MGKCECCLDLDFSPQGSDVKGQLHQLYASADAGCLTCQFLQRSVVKLFPSGDYNSQTLYDLGGASVKSNAERVDPAEIGLRASMFVSVRQEYGKKENEVLVYGNDVVNSDPGTWPKYSRFHSLPTRTNADESFAFAGSALDQCIQTHEDCKCPSSNFTPARLVDVGTDGDTSVFVVKTDSAKPTPYLALSHCWGPLSTITTRLLKQNQQIYETTGIPISSLPKTFREAVTFTRRFHHRYIWIDSFCIIQDSQSDWLNEAATMCSVYENAFLTLAAASSTNGHGGLFFEYPRLQHDVTMSDGSTNTKQRVFTRLTVTHETSEFPLMKRAWVLQERILSPRTLYFTDRELVWECRAKKACQCVPDGGGFLPEGWAPQKTINKLHLAVNPSARSMAAPGAAVKWRDIVEIYSSLDLTNRTDKLIAIDGMAQKIRASRPGARYAWGLWSDYFARDLLWLVDPSIYQAGRPTEWRAPSWSWAAVDNPVLHGPKIDEAVILDASFEVVRWPPDLLKPSITKPAVEECSRLRDVLVETTWGQKHVKEGSL